jgi:hypothetical protein
MYQQYFRDYDHQQDFGGIVATRLFLWCSTGSGLVKLQQGKTIVIRFIYRSHTVKMYCR